MPYSKFENLRMFYEDIGVGYPIIFLHGSLSRGIISFASQMFFFQSEFRCILPDFRGHGRTISEDGEWTTPQLADDVVKLLDDLNISKAHLVGFSLGGDVAMYCAIRYPDRFTSMVSISSTGSYNDDVIEYLKSLEPEELEKAGKANFIELISKNNHEACNGDWKAFIRQLIKNGKQYPDFTDDDLRRISIPSLFIIGEKDDMIKQNEIDRLKACISGVRIEKIGGCGHNLHTVFGKPMDVNILIYEFLKGKDK